MWGDWKKILIHLDTRDADNIVLLNVGDWVLCFQIWHEIQSLNVINFLHSQPLHCFDTDSNLLCDLWL